ncbi:unnamed protein product [Arctogadus glacialis]
MRSLGGTTCPHGAGEYHIPSWWGARGAPLLFESAAVISSHNPQPPQQDGDEEWKCSEDGAVSSSLGLSCALWAQGRNPEDLSSARH